MSSHNLIVSWFPISQHDITLRPLSTSNHGGFPRLVRYLIGWLVVNWTREGAWKSCRATNCWLCVIFEELTKAPSNQSHQLGFRDTFGQCSRIFHCVSTPGGAGIHSTIDFCVVLDLLKWTKPGLSQGMNRARKIPVERERMDSRQTQTLTNTESGTDAALLLLS